MKSLGFFIFSASFTSFVVLVFESEFKVFSWMDNWGAGLGIIIRLSFMILGIVLLFIRPKPLEEIYPELKEIHKLEEQAELKDKVNSNTELY